MREAATTALLALYSVPENVSPLHAFTARFSTRFAELVYDVSEAVAVKGVRASLFLVRPAPLLPSFPANAWLCMHLSSEVVASSQIIMAERGCLQL